MNARVLAALAALVLGIVAARFLQSPAPPAPAPAPAEPSEPMVRNETVEPGDAAQGLPESPVQTSELPHGLFVLARLSDSVEGVEAGFKEHLPTLRAAAEELGLSTRGEALVILSGSWEADTATFLALPVEGELNEKAVRSKGLSTLTLEGGDSMTTALEGNDYPRLLRQSRMLLQSAAEADGSPVGGVTLFQLDTSAEGKRVRATLSVMGPEDQPQL